MKISTKGRYALRLMLDLAMNGENNVVRIKDIAERQQISDKYLEQIISVLNKAGYVRSTRGPQGGYSLRKAPEEYTVGDILRLTEGSAMSWIISHWRIWLHCRKRSARRAVLTLEKISELSYDT